MKKTNNFQVAKVNLSNTLVGICLFHQNSKKHYTAQKLKFFIKDFFSKCDQIRMKLHFLYSARTTFMVLVN